MQHIYDKDDEFLKSLGEFITKKSSKAISDHGFFSIAFSGGSAATKVCQSLEREEYASNISWANWKVFFCDERFVEFTDKDSNYKAINDGLLQKHKDIDPKNVFTLNKTGTVADAAQDYEKKLRSVFPNSKLPQLDLVVLGMGPDGHICSLFPNHALLEENEKWIASLEDSPKPPPQRITFSLNVVNNASTALFITTGEGKAENIKKAIEGTPSKDIPASLVKLTSADLHWFMDKGAASLLKA